MLSANGEFCYKMCGSALRLWHCLQASTGARALEELQTLPTLRPVCSSLSADHRLVWPRYRLNRRERESIPS